MKKEQSSLWNVSRGRPVKQSNYGTYKQVISTGEDMNLRRVTITGDTPDIVQEVAYNAAAAPELYAESLRNVAYMRSALDTLKLIAPECVHIISLEGGIKATQAAIAKTKGE